ncbi:MAG: uroporphyrinogen decarboxylase family protein [candidate division WOR-3 bacterium]
MNIIEEVLKRKRRFAIFPIICADHCAHILHKNFKDVATNGEILAEVLEYGYNLYRYDMTLIFSDPYVEAEAMGCSLEYSPYPKLISNSELIRKKEIKALRLKSEIKGLRLKFKDRTDEIIKSAQILREKVDVPVFVSIKGPFTLACFLYDTEDLLKLLLNNETTARSIIRMALDFQVEYLDRLLKIPVNIFIGDPLASASVISPNLFKKFAYEPLRILINKIKSAGMIAGVHICGDTRPIIEFLDNSGTDILSIEDISHKTKTLKMGGVSTITLLNSDKKKIQKEIELALKQDFLILSTSCDVPVNTPAENIETMLDIARQYEN